MITFADDGALIISARLTEHSRAALGLKDGWRLAGLTPRHAPYLAWLATGWPGSSALIPLSSPIGASGMSTAKHREPYEPRGSRTDLGAPGGATPPGDSPKTLAPMSRRTSRSAFRRPASDPWRDGCESLVKQSGNSPSDLAHLAVGLDHRKSARLVRAKRMRPRVSRFHQPQDSPRS